MGEMTLNDRKWYKMAKKNMTMSQNDIKIVEIGLKIA